MATTQKRLTASDLTRGEKLYIYRLRLKFTQIQMAVEHDVCLSEYRGMEFDEEGVTCPYVSVGKLQLFEVCATIRRRKGINKAELAKRLRVTAYWLGRMESGTAPIARLANHWEARNELG
jgi:transcriptional regulator with XRE-family HTH domain